MIYLIGEWGIDDLCRSGSDGYMMYAKIVSHGDHRLISCFGALVHGSYSINLHLQRRKFSLLSSFLRYVSRHFSLTFFRGTLNKHKNILLIETEKEM